MVPDPLTPLAISKDQPVAPGNTLTPIPAAVEKRSVQKQYLLTSKLPETEWESALGPLY